MYMRSIVESSLDQPSCSINYDIGDGGDSVTYSWT